MILVNALPKSGTHALAAWLDTMGLKRCPGTMLGTVPEQHLHIEGAPAISVQVASMMPDNVFILGHVHAGHKLEGFRVVTVFRDPRNVLVSYCRHRKREDGLDVSIPEAIVNFWGSAFVETYDGFLGWRGRAITMRYEDMPPAMIGDGNGIYARHDRDWNTRTGAPSRWTDVWTRDAEIAWQDAGGPELLRRAGYI